MKRAPISATLGVVLLCAATGALAQASHQPVRRTVRAEQANPVPEVRIALTTMKPGCTSIDTGADGWSARGFDLKTLIAQIYDVDIRQVDLGDDSTAGDRYDLTVTLAKEVDRETMQRLLVSALERKFGLAITPEIRSMSVYVMSAPNGPGNGLHPHAAATGDGTGQISFFGKDCTIGQSANGLAVMAGTIADFRRTLEPSLDRVLVDETRLPGSYDFQIGNYSNTDDLFKALRDQLGLVVVPLERKVTVLKVRPQGEFASL
jgi:uncharacterized protein (TIGR03435 family)